MRNTVSRTLTVLFAAAALTGCQSGPRWAWWKSSTSPDDTSIIARSAAPERPSEQSAAVATAPSIPAGTVAAAQTNQTNVAAMASTIGAPKQPQTTGIPATSASTIANAPAASYPQAPTGPAQYGTYGSYANTAPSYPSTAFPSAPTAPGTQNGVNTNAPQDKTSVAQTTTSGTAPQYSVAQQGSYNPSTYQQQAASATQVAEAAPEDRYATPAGATADTSDRYTMPQRSYDPGQATQTTGQEGDRYGIGSAASAQPATTAPTNGGTMPAGGAYNPGAPDQAQTQVAGANVAAPVAQGVALDVPTGQYRPAGTTSYPYSSEATGPVNVASRPSIPGAPPAVAPPSYPSQTAPQVTVPSTTFGGSGTRTY